MKDLPQQKGHGAIVTKLFLIVIGMFGFGFAMVPLYDVFCDLTGLNGKVGVEAATGLDYAIEENREISLEFITSINESTPIKFTAETVKLKVNPGKFYTVFFLAENLADHAMVGQAIPSMTPGLATQYLKKTECFCFIAQEFEAGETKKMPVQFVIDPAIPEDYKNVTLAYTFFDITERQN